MPNLVLYNSNSIGSIRYPSRVSKSAAFHSQRNNWFPLSNPHDSRIFHVTQKIELLNRSSYNLNIECWTFLMLLKREWHVNSKWIDESGFRVAESCFHWACLQLGSIRTAHPFVPNGVMPTWSLNSSRALPRAGSTLQPTRDWNSKITSIFSSNIKFFIKQNPSSQQTSIEEFNIRSWHASFTFNQFSVFSLSSTNIQHSFSSYIFIPHVLEPSGLTTPYSILTPLLRR